MFFSSFFSTEVFFPSTTQQRKIERNRESFEPNSRSMNYKLEFLNSELRKIISNDAKTIDILVAEVDGQRGKKMENLN